MAKKTPRTLIKSAAVILHEVMLSELSAIGDAMIKQIIRRARGLPASQKLKAIKEIKWPGESAYLARLREALAILALDSLKEAKKEVPGKSRFKFSEEVEAITFADVTVFDQLPKKLREQIKKRSELLVGKQLSDLNSAVMFQYATSVDSTDSDLLVESDLKEAATEYVAGTGITSGASLAASQVVNDARSAFFFEDEVLEQVDAFMFVNGDPVTDICNDLNGTVFAKDDPEMFRYTPPLHWNCKSYIVPVPAGQLDKALKRSGQEGLLKLKPSTKKLEDSIQFSEGHCPHCQDKC